MKRDKNKDIATRKFGGVSCGAYNTIHPWLSRNYGKAKICEMKNCPGKSKCFDWALKKTKVHKKLRSHYMRLCRSCHFKYDMTPEKREQAIRNLRSLGKGEKHFNSKLKDKDIPVIRKLREQGLLYKEIALKYNVHAATIGYIFQKKKGWKHVK